MGQAHVVDCRSGVYRGRQRIAEPSERGEELVQRVPKPGELEDPLGLAKEELPPIPYRLAPLHQPKRMRIPRGGSQPRCSQEAICRELLLLLPCAWFWSWLNHVPVKSNSTR